MLKREYEATPSIDLLWALKQVEALNPGYIVARVLTADSVAFFHSNGETPLKLRFEVPKDSFYRLEGNVIQIEREEKKVEVEKVKEVVTKTKKIDKSELDIESPDHL